MAIKKRSSTKKTPPEKKDEVKTGTKKAATKKVVTKKTVAKKASVKDKLSTEKATKNKAKLSKVAKNKEVLNDKPNKKSIAYIILSMLMEYVHTDKAIMSSVNKEYPEASAGKNTTQIKWYRSQLNKGLCGRYGFEKPAETVKAIRATKGASKDPSVVKEESKAAKGTKTTKKPATRSRRAARAAK